VTGGVTLLLIRDATMVLNGAPARLRMLPRSLLYAELAGAVPAALLGAVAWSQPGKRARPRGVRQAPFGLTTVDRAASGTAALTFVVHALRQAIYLTPGQGRRGSPAREERSRQ
jgi:hypothetical protein